MAWPEGVSLVRAQDPRTPEPSFPNRTEIRLQIHAQPKRILKSCWEGTCSLPGTHNGWKWRALEDCEVEEGRAGAAGLCLAGPAEIKLFSEALTS